MQVGKEVGMASSYGSDASKTALEAQYTALGPSHFTASVLGDPIRLLNNLSSLDLWKKARVILLPSEGSDCIDMTLIGAKALEEGKRLGASVMLEEGPGEGSPSATSGDAGAVKRIDFVELDSPDLLHDPDALRAMHEPGVRSEGCTCGFACPELLDSLCVVPGLVFDGQGYRVGRDQGAYDRFLAFYPGHKVALVSALQISSNPLPRGAGDVPVDCLIDSMQVWRCK